MPTRFIAQIIGGVSAAVLLFALLAFDRNSVIAALHRHQLLPQPERFTELYLEDHLALPRSYNPKRNNSFTFTVHNLEHKPMDYVYVVEAISTESARIISRGNFRLEHDGYKSVTAKIASTEAQVRTKINISLENKDQSIHFWVDKSENTTLKN